MLAAIGFDDDAKLKRDEIDDVSSDRHLPPELAARKPPLPERMPALALGRRHLLPQPPRAPHRPLIRPSATFPREGGRDACLNVLFLPFSPCGRRWRAPLRARRM